MQSLSLEINPVLVYLPLLLVALAVAWLSYRRKLPQQFPAYLIALLLTLRTAGILLIGIMLCEPILALTKNRKIGDRLAVVLDLSSSMKIADSGVERWRIADSLRRTRDFLDGDNILLGFADSLWRLDFWPDSAAYSGRATNLAAALRLQGFPDREKVGAMLVITDGSVNVGMDPLRAASEIDIPVYSLVVGGLVRGHDTRIVKIDAPSIAYSNTEFEMEVIIGGFGHEGEDARIEISEGRTLLQSTKVKLPPDGAVASTKFKLTFPQHGLKSIRASITKFDDDDNPENNSRSFLLKVLKDKISIVIVALTLDWELSFLKNALEEDGHFKIDIALAGGQTGMFWGNLPAADQWSKYDLIIVIDGDPRLFGGQSGNIQTAVKGGCGFLYLAGVGSNRTRLQNWGELLPIKVTEKTEIIKGEFFPVPATEWLARSLASIEDYDWENAAPVGFLVAPVETKSGSQVILETKAANQNNPVCLGGQYGAGKTAVMLGFPWWPRQFQVEKSRAGIGRFWANMVRWLIIREDMDRFTISMSEDVLKLGQAVEFDAELLDNSYNLIQGGKIEVELSDSSSEKRRIILAEFQPGRYRGFFNPPAAGRYEFSAAALHDGDTIARKSGSFLVESASLEQENPSSNPALMKKIAEMTGGKSYTAADFAKFRDELKLKTGVVEESKEYRPIESLAVLLMIIGIFSAEWAIRKFNQLA